MNQLTNQELLSIEGGAISAGLALIIIAGVVFIIGIIDGYVRPLRCR